ncbi:3-methyladenine DNA glycosylase [Arthrobacter sp. JZ12]|uniref:3-methyladenine DNA glycosylase n=1 Tax=Arthrobacter sp. JZ12 TaxID=2654190 RepID=UPI002B46C6DC|nr:3-methyladenine DNA glycosylase [Arthrobacter sp. JZ12]WRH23920.1 3-methyladenine DNA glycosylase [Arthrobacter sp. JZ12]
MPPIVVLSPQEWEPRALAHAERVRAYTEPYLRRRAEQRRHPVEDFLFTYYTQKPAQLLRWHPGAHTVLTGPGAVERADWKFYRALSAAERRELGIADDDGAVTLDLDTFLRVRREAVDFARIVLSGTAARPAQYGCFGLHEWAMAYRPEENSIRHEYLNLRLGAGGTDEVVEANRIRCSHFDAFRFYAPQAVSLNELQPTRETQRDLEQPGCLHANMDLYKWAYKLTPALPSELVVDCFELSWRIRAVDMRASPYDLAEWGYPPIRIETPSGRADYVRIQRAFSAESQQMRAELMKYLEELEVGCEEATGRFS